MDHARIMHKPHRLALDESANLSDLRLFLFWSKALRSRLVSDRFDGQLSNLVDNSPSVLVKTGEIVDSFHLSTLNIR